MVAVNDCCCCCCCSVVLCVPDIFIIDVVMLPLLFAVGITLNPLLLFVTNDVHDDDNFVGELILRFILFLTVAPRNSSWPYMCVCVGVGVFKMLSVFLSPFFVSVSLFYCG